jgi:hypothetical protein
MAKPGRVFLRHPLKFPQLSLAFWLRRSPHQPASALPPPPYGPGGEIRLMPILGKGASKKPLFVGVVGERALIGWAD